MYKFITLLFLVFNMLYSCTDSCSDSLACNYEELSDCKYAYDQELLLTGDWGLVDIHNQDGDCMFSISEEWDCELDQVISSISIVFNIDKSCAVITDPSNYSDLLPSGNWSINICNNTINFSNQNQGYQSYIYPAYLPFGNQIIIELSDNTLIFEDPSGNLLRWNRS